MALLTTQISQLYVAIFNRASEGEGNAYWQAGSDTAAVADEMLATDAAKDYFGDALATDQAFIETIYANTLNKTLADDAEGIAYWVGRLDAGDSRGQIVSELVAAVESYADSTDAATIRAFNQFNNRVEVSDYTAANLQTAPADFATSLNFAADLTVTDDAATVVAAKTGVDAIVNPEVPATGLTAALNELAAANDAKSDLLQETVAANEKVAADLAGGTAAVADDPTDAEVETALGNVLEAAQGVVAANVAGIASATEYAANSDALNAARLSDEEAVNAKTLLDAEKALADANAEIAKVEGLSAAIAAYETAEKADIAADTTLTKAQTALTAATANFDAALEEDAGTAAEYTVAVTYTNSTVGQAGDKVSVTPASTGTAVEVIVFDADAGVFKLDTGITEDDYAGVTALLSAMNANISAVKTATEAQEAFDSAELTLDYLDSAGGTELKAVADAFVFSTPAIEDAPSDAEIQAEKDLFADKIDALDALAFANSVTGAIKTPAVAGDNYDAVLVVANGEIDGDTAGSDLAVDKAAAKAVIKTYFEAGYITADHKAEIDADIDAETVAASVAATAKAALALYNWDADQTTLTGAENDLKSAEVGANEPGFGALVTEYENQTDAVEAAEEAISDLAEAVSDLAAVEGLVESVEAAEEVIATAEKSFADQDLATPVTLEGGIELSGAENDLFVAGNADTEVRSMGVLGEDSLFIGNASYNAAVIGSDEGEVSLLEAGDDSVLEFFLQETGTGVNVLIEDKAFASSATGASDITTITLTGVSIDDVSVDGGLVSVA